MNNPMVRYIVGWVIRLEGLFLILPAVTAAVYREKEGFIFLGCAVTFTLLGWLMSRKMGKKGQLFARSGFVATALSWIILSAIGALPFYLSGEIPDYIDALFESASGFTTTGASILVDVEAMSHCMLFWRSFTHWIGGMGILVFVLTILPSAGGQTLYLMKAECTGPQTGKLYPRMQKTAVTLYLIYSCMTIFQMLLLIVGGMPLFDALCISFGTAGTGGFGVRTASCGDYSVYCQIVITVFMLLFGVNFNFYFMLLTKRWKDALKMEEVRWYLAIYVLVTVLLVVNLVYTGLQAGSLAATIKDAAFQTSSIMTSTGFATVDYDRWPNFCRMLLVMIMFTGACAGSTGGGMKVSRFIIWFKAVGKEIQQFIHPQGVRTIKLDGKAVSHETIRVINVYACAFVFVFACSMIVVAWDQFDFETTFSAVAATINNIGPGLGMVGPAGNFSGFSALSKLVFIFDMLAGRLEMFAILILFRRGAWKK